MNSDVRCTPWDLESIPAPIPYTHQALGHCTRKKGFLFRGIRFEDRVAVAQERTPRLHLCLIAGSLWWWATTQTATTLHLALPHPSRPHVIHSKPQHQPFKSQLLRNNQSPWPINECPPSLLPHPTGPGQSARPVLAFFERSCRGVSWGFSSGFEVCGSGFKIESLLYSSCVSWSFRRQLREEL